jgi:hypothetical protein
MTWIAIGFTLVFLVGLDGVSLYKRKQYKELAGLGSLYLFGIGITFLYEGRYPVWNPTFAIRQLFEPLSNIVMQLLK